MTHPGTWWYPQEVKRKDSQTHVVNMESEKTQLKSVLEGIEYAPNRLAFLFYWLEDINFHAEAARVQEALGPVGNKIENDLSALYLVARRELYTTEHWNFIRDRIHETYSEEQLINYYLPKLRNNEAVAMDGGLITLRNFQAYVRARQLAAEYGAITGFGTSLTFDEIMAIQQEIVDERARQARAYALD